METKRFIGLAVRRFFIPVALFCLALLPVFKPAQAAGGARNDSGVSGSFSSHLPVIVIENGGSTSPATAVSVYSGSPAGTFGSVPRKSPGASFDMRVTEEPGQTGPGKKSYTLSLASTDAVSLAGLPVGNAWRLQGSARDKGMLRNGIAYMLGRSLFPDTTPEIRFCEVLFKNGETYSYEGIFILAQRPEQKMRNGTVLEYSPGSDKRRSGANESFIGLSLHDRGFSSAHSRSDEAAHGLRMETVVDKLENALHSLQPDTFLSYAKALDQRSAVDLYLLNALLLNDKAGPVPFYISGENDGRLRFSPVWRFDEAFDNTASRRSALGFEEKAPVVVPPSILARKVPVWRQLENGGDITNLRLYPVYSAMGGDNFLWFDRLFLSRPFLKEMLSRYHALQRGPFSPANLSATVDALATVLGPALERDWARWQTVYAADAPAPYVDPKGENHIRQTLSFDQELVKIRYALNEQNAFLMERITQMNRVSADLFDTATSGNRQAGYALITIIAFLILTHFLTRKV